METPGVWDLMRSRWAEAYPASNGVDDVREPRVRKLPVFARTWLGAAAVVLLSLGIDLLMVIGALDRTSDACSPQSMSALLVSSLVVMVLVAVPALEPLAWLAARDGRRWRSLVACVVVVAGFAITVFALIAISHSLPSPMLCD